ncbi:hypothetical protein BH09MYX1_BH09MYX1_13690 [soil metagenome]
MTAASSTSEATSTVLSGGGEMGALMRQTDWAATPLGPVATWPQSLKTAVSILLDSRFGMYIAWGPQYVQIYNDGYRPILGATKHPRAMGNVASDTFAESWDIIRPMFEDVRRGIAVGSDDWMLPLDRFGYLEECFFTFSYSPIRDESGGVGGIHVTVTETTQRVLAARRLSALHALVESTFGKRTATEAALAAVAVLGETRGDVPFAMVYLLDGETHGLRLAASVGVEPGSVAAAPESWPLAAVLADGRIESVADIATRFAPIPSRIWPENVESAVVVPIRRAGEDAGCGVLVAGVSPRRAMDADYTKFFALAASHLATAIADTRVAEAERRLVDAERERLYAHFLQAPFPVAVFRGPTHVVELANPAALAVWGKT